MGKWRERADRASELGVRGIDVFHDVYPVSGKTISRTNVFKYLNAIWWG